MGEEEDYMSDAFLKQFEDVRPGLCKGRKKRRDTHKKHETLPKHKRTKLTFENTASSIDHKIVLKLCTHQPSKPKAKEQLFHYLKYKRTLS